MFVNSTISLEGVVASLRKSGDFAQDNLVIGCFGWDPFAALLSNRIYMVRQDVDLMMRELFIMIVADRTETRNVIQVPPII
jgi:LacI family fructose operon transcriptional repressor